MLPLAQLSLDLPDPVSTGEIVNLLGEKYTLIECPSQTSDITFFDTFDLRLFEKNRLCYLKDNTLHLTDFADRQLVPPLKPGHPPRFWWQFPKSDVKQVLAGILDVRGLLPQVSFSQTSRELRITNKDEKIVEMVLSKRPVDTTIYVKKVLGGLLLDDQMQPMGPIVSVRDMTIEVRGTDHAIEKVYSDDDLKAYDAMLELYRRGVLVSKIIRCLSAGLLGKISERRLVPTRWSITAVDSILSMWLRDNLVKQNPVIGEYRVHEFSNLGDKFIVILFPHVWSYELIEAWFPGTLWNPWNDFVGIAGDWETYHGREGYASIGGCYYAARLAVSEFLAREGKQAAVLILRESYPEHILPVGVWHVRESVRAALKQKPIIFSDLRETLDYVFSRLKISSDIWMKTSSLLRFILRQRKLDDYLKHSSTMR